jgi:hypothetical protein
MVHFLMRVCDEQDKQRIFLRHVVVMS